MTAEPFELAAEPFEILVDFARRATHSGQHLHHRTETAVGDGSGVT